MFGYIYDVIPVFNISYLYETTGAHMAVAMINSVPR